VITVPKRRDPPDLLWRRFAGVVGIDPDVYDISRAFTNTSLGAAEAMFLRRLNLALDNEVGWPLYNEMVKHHLAMDVLINRPNPKVTVLARADLDWAQDRAHQIADQLAAAGYDVAGSLDDLRPTEVESVTNSGEPTVPTAEEQLDIAIEAIASLLLRISRLRRKVIRP
jgi:hypothetical protein